MSFKISAGACVALPVTVALAGAGIPATADSGTLVPLRSILRACDFTPLPRGAAANYAAVSAVIHSSGGQVTADVHLAEPSQPGTHYDVILIQSPRPSNAPCDSPGPGVAVTGLDSDPGGVGNATVRDSIRPGTTGAWVYVRRPSPISQGPVEFYTSDFTTSV